MPLTKKGKKIMTAMSKEYGKEKGKEVFYASRNGFCFRCGIQFFRFLQDCA